MVDQRSEEVVYRRHAQELVRFASGLVGVDDAPDVVSNAFIRLAASSAWAEAGDRRALWFRAVAYEAETWKRSNIRRRDRERRARYTATWVATMPEPDYDIVAAFSVLSNQQRAVVMLTYWADHDPVGISELLGVSQGTVRKQLARARRKLRSELDER